MVKLVAERATGRFVGAHILAPEAGDLIQQIVIAMKFGKPSSWPGCSTPT